MHKFLVHPEFPPSRHFHNEINVIYMYMSRNNIKPFISQLFYLLSLVNVVPKLHELIITWKRQMGLSSDTDLALHLHCSNSMTDIFTLCPALQLFYWLSWNSVFTACANWICSHSHVSPVADPGGCRGGHAPSPSPVQISHKKDGRQKRPHRFHVSWPPYPTAGPDAGLCISQTRRTFELSVSNHLNENAETSTQYSGKVVVPRSLDQRQGHTGKIIIHTILCS